MSGIIKILVADDDVNILTATARLLEREGYEVIKATDGSSAIAEAIKFMPDLALLDMVMPDITGLDVCKVIKENSHTRNCFVVILSSTMNTPDNQADGLESGADGYIGRPIGNRELLARVEAMVRIKIAEQELRHSKGMLNGILNASLNGIIAFKSIRGKDNIISDFKYLHVNKAAGDILGGAPDFYIGKNLLDVFPGHLQSGLFDQYVDVAQNGINIDVEQEYNFDNKKNWYRILAISYEDGFVVTFSDITELKKKEEVLSGFATTDALTGLLNRRTGMALLENKILVARREKMPLSVCFIDVNSLKMVNDTYGHGEGDELLKIVSNILKESVRDSDALCRLGGDEFLFILPKCKGECSDFIWNRILEKMNQFNLTKVKPYKVSVSHGFAEYNLSNEMSANELVEFADSVMYEEKRKCHMNPEEPG